MKLDITSRNFTSTDMLKEYINEKMERLDKFSLKIDMCHVVLHQEKVTQICEIILVGKNLRLTAIEETKAMQASFDAALSNLQNQLRRYHDKIKDYRNSKIQVNVENADEDEY